jgi:hypothetical protein
MDYFILILLIGLVIGLPFSILLALLYWVPKAVGHRKVGIILASLFACLSLGIAFPILFDDQLFTKSDARGLLAEQNIHLQDDFDIVKNESTSSVGDYYHTFTLRISQEDKHRVIAHITGTTNFKRYGSVVPDWYQLDHLTDRYTGKIITLNCETDHDFVTVLLKPIGKGYAPLHRVITVSKHENELVFEDIDL